MAKQEQIKRSDVPEGWSLEAADFVNKVINKALPIYEAREDDPKEALEQAGIQRPQGSEATSVVQRLPLGQTHQKGTEHAV